MNLFGPLYDLALRWSRSAQAPRWLAALSFAESSFFPIPPDVMLAPMTLATPKRAWWYATLTTIASVAGGLLGYGIGFYLFESLQPHLLEWGYSDKLALAQDWFAQWGIWVVFLAGFTPIPYKIFTITAGALALTLPGFVLASLIGRGARFFLVAALVRFGFAKHEASLRANIELTGWLTIAVFTAAGGLWWWLR